MDWKRLFDLAGRASRSSFWAITFVGQLVFWLGVLITVNLAAVFGLGWLLLALLLPIPLAAVVAVTARRLHDRGRSAWWIVPLCGLAAAGALMDAAGVKAGPASAAADAFGAVLALWAILELGFFPGKKGPNKYAPANAEPVGSTDLIDASVS